MRAAKYLVSRKRSEGGERAKGPPREAKGRSPPPQGGPAAPPGAALAKPRRGSRETRHHGATQKQLGELCCDVLGAPYAAEGGAGAAELKPPPPLRKGVCLAPLGEIWDEVGVPQPMRDAFLRAHTDAPQGYAVSTLKQDVVHAEAARVGEIKKRTVAVLKMAAAREEGVKALAQALQTCPPRVLALPVEDVRKEHDHFVVALARAVQGVRKATVDVLDALRSWRGFVALPHPFTYRGAVYVEKIRTDLAFLPADPVAQRFLKPDVICSPLLCSLGRVARGGVGDLRRSLPARLLEAAETLRSELALTSRPGSPQEHDSLLFDSASSAWDAAPAAATPPVPALCGPGSAASLSQQQSILRGSMRAARAAAAVAAGAAPADVTHLGSTHASLRTVASARVDGVQKNTSEVEPGQITFDLADDTASHPGDDGAEQPPGTPPLPLAVLLAGGSPVEQTPAGGEMAIIRVETEGDPAAASFEDASPTAAMQACAAKAAREHDAAVALQVMLFRGKVVPYWRRRDRRNMAELADTTYAALRHAEAAARGAVEARGKAEIAAARVQQFYLDRKWGEKAKAARAERQLLLKQRRAALTIASWISYVKQQALARKRRRCAREKYVRRKEWEAEAVAKYDAAYPYLQRLGRGCLRRKGLLEAKLRKESMAREHKRQKVAATLLMWVHRRRFFKARADRAGRVAAERRRGRRDVAALMLQAWWRGRAAVMYCEQKRQAFRLDEGAVKVRAAKVLLRALRVNAARCALRCRRAAKAAALQPIKDAALRAASADKIHWWWLGRKAQRETRGTLYLRQRWREEYVQKVSERYRSIMTNNKLNATVLARVVTMRWEALKEWIDEPKDADDDAWSSDPEEEDQLRECDVNTVLSNQLVPKQQHLRRLLVFLQAARGRVSSAQAEQVMKFLMGSVNIYVPVVNQPRPTATLATLDLSLVARQEDNAGQLVLNNLLRLPRAMLFAMLGAIYNGAPPPLKETWGVVIFMTRVMSDWGAHAVIGYLDDVPCDPDDPEAPRLLDVLLGDLRLPHSDDLLALLKRDPYLLLDSQDKLSDVAVRVIEDVFPTHHDDWMSWVYEMGCLQILSVLPDDTLDAVAGRLGVPTVPAREEQEKLIARQAVTAKASA
eukprot:TRINITY_DN4608_c0_g1_i1.p1 TRINITY_DN4608_c0_g1~~TRINITY_DN4608_c0_g1_i1.p1  ORF type:complete len:1129 (+),score=455.09 TRINITY_DN4608_c0_g1_i1:130-3516(+)